ncbi:MAG: tetratricopeptide repeat protein [Bacteroidales bacterium]|nr:tetratricopeptide repeat protein [Bacteroidales bacterium]
MIKRINYFWMAVLMAALGACSLSQRHTAGPASPAEQEEKTEVSVQDQLESTAILIEASRHKMLGNINQAASLYADAIEKDPGNDAAMFELSKIHTRRGDFEKALELAARAARIDPTNPYYQMLLADIYILNDQTDKATEIYVRLAESDPDNYDFQQKLLSVYLYRQEYRKALEVLDHMEHLAGPSEDAGVQKIRLLIALDELEEAIRETEKMIQHFPDETSYYELLGELYAETGRQDRAIALYRKLLEEDSENIMAALFLAEHYLEQQEMDTAISYITMVFQHPRLGVDAKSGIIFSFMFYAEEEQQGVFLKKAQALAQMLVEVHPDEAEAYYVYGDILIRNEEWESARSAYLRGARLDPSNLAVWQQILNLDLRLRDYESMRKHAEMSLEYFFEQPVLFLFNGLASMQLKEYEAAASSLEYGLALTVDNKDLELDFITMLGDAYHYLGAFDESDRYYAKALARDPENATALNNYAYHLSLRKERLDEALAMSEKANRLSPGNPALQDTHGWVNYQMGRYTEAERWIRKAVENDETPSGTVLEHYGDVLYKLGRHEDAMRYWLKAREAEGGSDLLYKKIEEGTLYE